LRNNLTDQGFILFQGNEKKTDEVATTSSSMDRKSPRNSTFQRSRSDKNSCVSTKNCSLTVIRSYVDSFRLGILPHEGGGIGFVGVVMLFL